jgi:hypothetical protein
MFRSTSRTTIFMQGIMFVALPLMRLALVLLSKSYAFLPKRNIYLSVYRFPGGEFTFNCWGPSGAVLALPHGSHLEKLENVESMRRYAAKHAESWYKYVNETRGRGLVNGNLLLVTGWEKAESWGMAFYQDVISGFQLAFGPTADAANRYRYRWHGTHCRRKHADSHPVDGTPLNQTTFIHAFAISVCEGIWGKLFGVEICQPADSSTFQDKPGRGFIPYQSRGSSFGWSFFFGSSHSGGKQYSEQAPGDGLLSDASPIPKVRAGNTHFDRYCIDLFQDHSPIANHPRAPPPRGISWS